VSDQQSKDQNSKTTISGQVFTAMVTPFDGNGSIDEAGVARVVDHLFENGSDGLVVCGTTGESPTLSHDEKLEMFRLVVRAAKERGPVLAGTGTNDTASSITLSSEAAAIGADGLLLVGPYYNKPSQEGYFRHFRAIAEAVDLPVMLYNVPPRTAGNIEAATVLRLAREVPNIIAVKEASGNFMQISEILAGAPEGFRVYSGEDGLVLPMLALGSAGVVSVTAHAVGRDLKAMHTAFFSGNLGEAARLHAKMLPVVRALFQSTTPSPAPVKTAMNLLGVPVGSVRLPLVDTNENETEIVRKALADYGLLG
jgi:4-hydroxy-tetrahydrodipicolinate synthase